MGDSLWAMLFCELLRGGVGGPATTGMDLDTWIDHCLRYHDGRFAECIDFIFFCYSLKQRKKLNGIVATAARTRSGRASGGGDEDVDLTTNQQAPSVDDLRLAAAALADAVSPPADQQQKCADPSVAAALEEGRKTLKLLSVYSKTFEGTAAQMMLSRRELLAMIQSGHSGTPVYFGTTAAADVEGWPEIFHMIGAHRIKKRFPSITALETDIDGIISQLTKEQCATLVKENPVIVIRHYRDRFNALWDHILCGKAKPLGEISDYWRRDDAQQRGSFHTHMLIFIKWLSENGRMAELMESEDGRAALLRMFDDRISAWYSQLPPGYTEEGIAVQELQDAIRRSLQAEGPEDPRPCPVCGTGDDGDSAFLLCSSCNDPIGHNTCIGMTSEVCSSPPSLKPFSPIPCHYVTQPVGTQPLLLRGLFDRESTSPSPPTRSATRASTSLPGQHRLRSARTAAHLAPRRQWCCQQRKPTTGSSSRALAPHWTTSQGPRGVPTAASLGRTAKPPSISARAA
jgi:hypothetical protein